MNKTVKTIAWICLVLGIMGLLLDAGIVLHLGRIRAERQAAVEAGELPFFKGAPQSGTQEGEESESTGPDTEKDSEGVRPQRGFIPQVRADRMRGILQGRRDNPGILAAPVQMPGHLPFLFIFFFGVGPVLAVIGAVTLIVNRQSGNPEPEEVKEEKKDKKKASKTK